ncbi:L-2-hydroxyglutarate oxidase [Alteromonas sediminis]|uniref:L-2-hydroxyglutarate oxidase n=2 Tax=Alteromonas sediminis TaxID=2259342 RepID=A0A3N5Y1V1_9ALTE|nr:L-2-hydroxyglutarate oxidase [Alteromonas sediminis]
MQLVLQKKNARVIVIEREKRPAQHQTGRNSGVIHAGVYYAPGSLKAVYCREGCEQTLSFCQQHNIPHERCGKLLVATSDHEIEGMQNLYARCKENGLSPTLLSKQQIGELEPHIQSVGGFKVSQSGITDYKAVCQAMLNIAEHSGRCQIVYDQKITAIEESANALKVFTSSASTGNLAYTGTQLVNCAGLYADEVAKMAGLLPDVRLLPFRGEYFRLSSRFDGITNHLVYPIPDPNMPFLGVHLTKMIGGFTTVGPNAVLASGREAYENFSFSATELKHIFSFPGTWKLLWQHRKSALREAASSLSRQYYLTLVQRYCNAIKLDDLGPFRSGIRAQAVSIKGELVHDFAFAKTPLSLHVINAPSPAATSAIPIANDLIQRLSN